MDPNANLREQLDIADELAKIAEDGGVFDQDDAFRLVDLVLALNAWIAEGGALPSAWGAWRRA